MTDSLLRVVIENQSVILENQEQFFSSNDDINMNMLGGLILMFMILFKIIFKGW